MTDTNTEMTATIHRDVQVLHNATPAERIDPTEEQATTVEAVPEPELPDIEDDPKPGREAAKYRRQLREVEAERDQLREVVSSYQRAAVEASAAKQLAAPSLLWESGKLAPADLVGDDGQPDSAKVEQAVKDLVSVHGREVLAARLTGGYAPNEGRQPRRFTMSQSFTDAFRPKE